MFLFVLHNDCLFPGELVSVWQAVVVMIRYVPGINASSKVSPSQALFVRSRKHIRSNKTSNGPVLVIIPLGTLFLFQVKSCAPFLLFQNRYKLAFIQYSITWLPGFNLAGFQEYGQLLRKALSGALCSDAGYQTFVWSLHYSLTLVIWVSSNELSDIVPDFCRVLTESGFLFFCKE